MSVPHRREIHQPGVDVFEDAAHFAQRPRAVFNAAELGEQLAGLFAAAISDGFFQHRPQVGLRVNDPLPVPLNNLLAGSPDK